MNNKMRNIQLFIAFILVSSACFGLGIAPATKVLKYEPDLYQSISYRIYNPGHKDINLTLSVEGDLINYLSWPEEIHLTNDIQVFYINVSLPSALDKNSIATISLEKDGKDTGAMAELAVLVPTQYFAAPELEVPGTVAISKSKKMFFVMLVLAAIFALAIIFYVLRPTSVKVLEEPPQQKGEPFYLANGKIITTLTGLVRELEALDEAAFCHHVNAQKNDFATWIFYSLQKHELARYIKPIKDKERLTKALKLQLMIDAAEWNKMYDEALKLKEKLNSLKEEINR